MNIILCAKQVIDAEAPPPAVVTVSNKISESRYPTIKGIMAAKVNIISRLLTILTYGRRD
jgi:electron transfer flavoprotein alpha/beta subunit